MLVRAKIAPNPVMPFRTVGLLAGRCIGSLSTAISSTPSLAGARFCRNPPARQNSSNGNNSNPAPRRYFRCGNFIPKDANGAVNYNTKSVDVKDFKSYWDLLNPKWKGKIVTIDPLVAGPINTPQIFFYKHPELGPEFLRRLYAETNMTIVRSDDQLMDWLSTGRYALGFGARDVDKAIAQGLPINQFVPNHMKEGASLATYNGTLSFFNRAPHPNAARLFNDFLLSREGQELTAAAGYYAPRTDVISPILKEAPPKTKIIPCPCPWRRATTSTFKPTEK